MIEFLEEIEQHFRDYYPKEGCGVLSIEKGKLKWYPCKNVAEDNEDFIIDSKQYLEIKKKGDVVGIVHSHPDKNNTPSTTDINYCNALGVKYYIFSYPDMELYILEPTKVFNPLIGREYKFGVSDCFEAAKDYYRTKLNIDIPNRLAYEDEWWEKGLDYFSEEHIKTWNFSKVSTPKEHDLLIFQINADVPNHCGVYLDNSVFFHHACNRLSCRESLYPFWAEHLVGTYRYET